MPYPNFHSARIRQPGLFRRIRQIREAEGGSIRFIGGPLKSTGSVAVQAVRFAKGKYTPAEARAWLKEHDEFSNPISFEEAGEAEDSADLPLIGEHEVLRFDETAIAKVSRNEDGTISGEAITTRAGVFTYRMTDGTLRKEYRPPEEVFRADSMASAKMLPITNGHPTDFVTPENAKELSIGWTGENVRRHDNFLIVPVKITTKEGIDAVNGGRRQLSHGYKCTVVEQAGHIDGEDYTHIQRNIVQNHLALVDQARAGTDASLRLDAADAVMHVEDTRKESRTMKKVQLDNGLEYDASEEVAVEFEKARKDATEAKTQLGEAQKNLDTVTAERDEFKARAEKAEKIDHSEAIKAGVVARLDVLGKARKVLDEEGQKKLDEMSDEEIRLAVIKAKYPDLNLEGKSADYIGSRFDAIVETLEDKGDNSTAQRNADTVMGKPGQTRTDEAEKREQAIAAIAKRSRGEDK